MNYLNRRVWFLACLILFSLLLGACREAAPEVDTTDVAPPSPTALLATPSSLGALPATASPSPDSLSAYPPAATPSPVGAYPGPPTTTATLPAYPPPGPTRPATTAEAQVYLPSMSVAPPTPTPTLPATPTPPPTPTPTIDFQAVRAQLQAENQDLGFVKMGFHTGPGGNRTGLGEWMHRLDDAGVPFFLKSVDDTGALVEAQEIMRESDVPHTLVYRHSGQEYDVPDYSLPPVEAARQHWQLHMAAWPPELDPELVWLETINEVDKERSEWLAQFALETAQLALADGFRWAAFGWSSGEPEAADWQSPAMLEFLKLAAANPDRLAIALHEYSYRPDEIAHQYPYKLGRFQELYRVADQHGIPRPTVLITEWGWAYDDIPPSDQAMADIAWASRLYASYPQVKGAAIWYLGPGYSGIANQTQPLIVPLTEYALGNYFAIPLPPAQAPIAPEQFSPPS